MCCVGAVIFEIHRDQLQKKLLGDDYPPRSRVLICGCALRHQPGREGRKAPKTYGHTAIPADLLMEKYCEQVVHSRYTYLFTAVTAGQLSPGPPAGSDRRAGHPRLGHMKVG